MFQHVYLLSTNVSVIDDVSSFNSAYFKDRNYEIHPLNLR